MAVIGRIRKHSWLAVVVIGLAIVAFIIGDFAKGGSNGMPSNIGSIGGDEISFNEFNSKVEELETNYKIQQKKDQVTNEEHFEIQEQAWSQMLETRLFQKEFENLGITVTPAEMNDMFFGDFIHPYLAQNPSFVDPQTGQYNRNGIRNHINNFNNIPEEQKKEWRNLEIYIKTERLNSKYSVLLAKSFYTPTALAKHKIKVQSQLADVRYIVNSFSEIPDDKVKPTEADYQKYYDEHQKQFKQEDSRDIEFVVFPVMPSTQDLLKIDEGVKATFEEFQTTSTEDLLAFVTSESDHPYDSIFHRIGTFNPAIDSIITKSTAGQFIPPFINNNEWIMAKVLKFENRPDSMRMSLIPIFNKDKHEQFTRTHEQVKILVDSLLAVLKTDSSAFMPMLNMYSDDPNAKENGGDQGWMQDGMIMKEIQDKLLASNVGDVFTMEEPGETGYYIIKVTGKTPEVRKAQVAIITREITPSEATKKEISDQANKFAAESRTFDDMTKNVAKYGLSKRSADFTPEMANRLPGIQDARQIVRWAFEKNTKKGDVSPTVFESGDMLVVAALKEIRLKGYATLDQVRSYIEAPVKIEKKAEMLIEKANKAIAETKDINMLAVKLNTTVDTVPSVSFVSYSFGKNGPEMNVIGAVSAATAQKLLAPIKGYNGVYTVQVDKVYQNEQVMDPKMVAAQIDMQNQQKLRGVINVLKDKTVIKDNRAFFY